MGFSKCFFGQLHYMFLWGRQALGKWWLLITLYMCIIPNSLKNMFILLWNSIQINIYQALLGATYYKHWTLSLLEWQGIRSFISIFRRGKGGTEKLSDWAQVKFLKQQLDHMPLVFITFQWLLMPLKSKFLSRACEILPDLCPSLSSHLSCITLSLAKNVSATSCLSLPQTLSQSFFPLQDHYTNCYLQPEYFSLIFFVELINILSAFKTGFKYCHLGEGLLWSHYLSNILVLSSLHTLLFTSEHLCLTFTACI